MPEFFRMLQQFPSYFGLIIISLSFIAYQAIGPIVGFSLQSPVDVFGKIFSHKPYPALSLVLKYVGKLMSDKDQPAEGGLRQSPLFEEDLGTEGDCPGLNPS